jgi:two-component system, NarL family, nitrate/nitrite response regulator NarL
MKVLAADGYILCRGLVRTLTLLRDDVCVIAADSIDEVLAHVSDLPDLDLVLLDERMPGMENFAGLRRAVETLPGVPIVVTSPNESPAHIIAAIRNGASGYFPLSTKPCVLEHALPLILSGEYYIPACALRVGRGNRMLARDGVAPGSRTADDGLTSWQREIIVMLAEGKSNKEIARELKVIEGTIKLHVKGILRKLGVRNRTEAVVAAARKGYLPKVTLGMDVSVSERTAANAERAVFRERAPAPPPQSDEGVLPSGEIRAPRPRRPRGRQSEDRTAATKEPSYGNSPAVPIGLNDHDQIATMASAKAPNAASLSLKKSKSA